MINKESRILVTGASRGLGKSLVEILVKKSLNITVVARGFYDLKLKKKLLLLNATSLKKMTSQI